MQASRKPWISPAPEAQQVLHFVTEEDRQRSVSAYVAQVSRDAARAAREVSRAQQPGSPQIVEVKIRNLDLFRALLDDVTVAADEEHLVADAACTEGPAAVVLHPEDPHDRKANTIGPPPASIAMLDMAPLQIECAMPEGDEHTAEELREKQADIDALADHAELFVAWFMERNLRTLTGVGSRKAKLDTLDWILAPDIDGDVMLRDGSRRVPVFTDKVPLSFTWCCKLFGLSRERYVDGLRAEIAGAIEHLEKPHHKETFRLMLAKLGENQ